MRCLVAPISDRAQPDRGDPRAPRDSNGATGRDDSSAVILVEIAALADVEERYGPQVVAALLGIVEQRLAAVVRVDDSISAQPGGAFALRCVGCSRENALVVADRLRNAVTRPVAVDGLRLGVDASVGVAQTDRAETDGQLLERAERALARARKRGRNRVELSRSTT